MACAWIGVAISYPARSTARSSSGRRPSSVNFHVGSISSSRAHPDAYLYRCRCAAMARYYPSDRRVVARRDGGLREIIEQLGKGP